MKKLDKSIIQTVYLFETEHTFFEFLLSIIFIIACGVLGFLSGLYVYHQLVQGQTLDLFDLFSENIEVVKKYLWDVMTIFYQETPKLALLTSVIFVILTIIFLIIFIRSFKKFSNKIKSLLSYWHYHHHSP